MSWYKITFAADLTKDINTANIVNIAAERKQQAGHPKDFAIFERTVSDDPETVLYLSPVAASLCVPKLKDYSPQPCNAPPANEKGLKPLFGNLSMPLASISWPRRLLRYLLR